MGQLRHPLAGVAGLVVAAFLVSGCSFTPLYGVGSNGVQVADELANVYVIEKDIRLEQLIRNNLITNMSPPGSAQGTRYTLDFQSNAGNFGLVLERNTDVSRRLYRLDVKYTLTDNQSGEVVHEGRTFSHVAYDRLTSEFSNIQAQINAEERAATEVGEDITTRIAAHFSNS